MSTTRVTTRLPNETVAAIEAASGRAVAVQGDVGKVGDIERLFDAAFEHFGKLDILVNNAGVMFNKPVADVTEEEFDRIFAVNVKGTFFTCQQAAKRMADGGRIINFSSSTTAMMLPTYGTYVATKGAVEQIVARPCQGTGFEGHHGQRRLAGTDRHGTVWAGEDRARQTAVRPVGSSGQTREPEDIADVVALLVSDDASWITGQNIRANGGTI